MVVLAGADPVLDLPRRLTLEVSMGVPQLLDGLFHEKSQTTMDDFGATPMLGNHPPFFVPSKMGV